MILSDKKIKEYLDSGVITIIPKYKESDIRPVGVRLHLHDEILIPVANQTIDFDNPIDIKYETVKIPDSGYLLNPNDFILASSVEQIMLPPNIVGKLDGRSTIARLGIMIHCSSNIVDGNHDEPRSIVYEIKNLGNFRIILRKNMPLAMLVFNQVSESISQQSQAQYSNQKSVTPPNIHFKPDQTLTTLWLWQILNVTGNF